MPVKGGVEAKDQAVRSLAYDDLAIEGRPSGGRRSVMRRERRKMWIMGINSEGRTTVAKRKEKAKTTPLNCVIDLLMW